MTEFPVDTTFNNARMKHLGSLGLDLKKKRVLEVGAGIGELTWFWEDLDCDVVSTEARQINIEKNLLRHKGRTVLERDVTEKDSHKDLGMFDIVFCYGLLYHVPDPSFVICDLSKVCSELFLVESMVQVEDGPPDMGERQEYIGINQGLYKVGCTPTRSWFMMELGNTFPYVYMPRTQPKNQRFPLSWPGKPRHLARAVFIASMTKLDNPTLSTVLLKEQAW